MHIAEWWLFHGRIFTHTVSSMADADEHYGCEVLQLNKTVHLKRPILSYFALNTLGGPWQYQLECKINYKWRHVGERDPDKLGIPAGTVSGSWMGRSQSVLHAAGYFCEVWVTNSLHEQTLDLNNWKKKKNWINHTLWIIFLFFLTLSIISLLKSRSYHHNFILNLTLCIIHYFMFFFLLWKSMKKLHV